MRSFFALCLILPVVATMAKGATTPPDLDTWRKSSLGVASGQNNQWYFHPDANQNPRVLVKATGITTGDVTRRLLTGGPPVWTTGAAMNTASLNKQGVTVRFGNGIYFIAPHGDELWMTFFNAAGTAVSSKLIDTAVPITSVGLSAALEEGYIHIAYVGSSNTASETLRYARYEINENAWLKDSLDLSTQSDYIQQTVILPSSETSAKIYASLKSGSDMSLLRVSVSSGNIGAASGDGNMAIGTTINENIAGARINGADYLYFFGKVTATGEWHLKQVISQGVSKLVQDTGVSLPTSMICKAGPDNKPRVVWLNGMAKEINYLKQAADPKLPYVAIQPVTGTTGTAEVRGLHFDAANKPYLLYRNSGSVGFIAYPDEEQDTNGNGRPDLLDVAFNSNTAGVEILDPIAAAPGLPLSQNKFKFRIPTVGSAIQNGSGGLYSSTRGLTYQLETSTDAVTWTTLGLGSPVIFVQHSTEGTYPNEVKVFSGMYNETIPAAPSRRFFRIKVSRPAGAY